ERLDAGVHARDDRDAGLRDAVEATQREGLGVAAVVGNQLRQGALCGVAREGRARRVTRHRFAPWGVGRSRSGTAYLLPHMVVRPLPGSRFQGPNAAMPAA